MNKIVFECTLTEGRTIYKSGDYVTGVISVDFGEATKIRGIDVRFLGQAMVNWTETKRSANDSRRIITKQYRNKETYFDTTLVVFGRAENEPGDNEEHPPGLQRYPFRFQLPSGLPSSFDGSYGSVSYAILGLLDIPWAPDKAFRKKVKIVSDLDLNDIPPATDSLVGHDEKTLCCLCCKHGPIVAEFSVPQAGYVPGERILVNASVMNNSRRKVLRTEVKLKQTIIYRSSATKTKLVNKEILSIVDEEDILKGGHFQWENEPIAIPPCPPSFLPYCSIIDIRYELVFNIDVAGTSIDMEMPLELIIGTIPLKYSKAGVSRRGTRHSQTRSVTAVQVLALSPDQSPAKSPSVVTQQPRTEDSPFEGNENAGFSAEFSESPSDIGLPTAVT